MFHVFCIEHHIPYLLFHAADSHPQDLNNAVPGKPVAFTLHATGTKPLMHQWQWKPAEEGSSSREWQECDAEIFPDASSPKLIISSVQTSKEGSYRCVVSNCAGIQPSKPANLSVGKLRDLNSHILRESHAFHLQLTL